MSKIKIKKSPGVSRVGHGASERRRVARGEVQFANKHPARSKQAICRRGEVAKIYSELI